MALRNIVTLGNPVLRNICKPVTDVDDYVKRLLGDMVETLRDVDGVGLAAPQVGVRRRIVVIEVDDVLYELINPEIIESEGGVELVEACLSVPGRAGLVLRPERVKVRAMDRNGDMREYEGEGLLAQAFCHEIDHLDGIVYTDVMIREVDPNAEEDDEE